MPYKDPEEKRRHAREWARNRRLAWLADKVCAECGTTTDLHVIGAKVHGPSAFTGTAERRDALLADARVLCGDCAGLDATGRQLSTGTRPPRRSPTPPPAEVVTAEAAEDRTPPKQKATSKAARQSQTDHRRSAAGAADRLAARRKAQAEAELERDLDRICTAPVGADGEPCGIIDCHLDAHP